MRCFSAFLLTRETRGLLGHPRRAPARPARSQLAVMSDFPDRLKSQPLLLGISFNLHQCLLEVEPTLTSTATRPDERAARQTSRWLPDHRLCCRAAAPAATLLSRQQEHRHTSSTATATAAACITAHHSWHLLASTRRTLRSPRAAKA